MCSREECDTLSSLKRQTMLQGIEKGFGSVSQVSLEQKQATGAFFMASESDCLMHIRENKRENLVMQEMMNRGWFVITKGCPDLICIRGNELKFIEVKPYSHQFTEKGGLSYHQKIFIQTLKKHGFDVEVRYVE